MPAWSCGSGRESVGTHAYASTITGKEGVNRLYKKRRGKESEKNQPCSLTVLASLFERDCPHGDSV